MRFTLDIDYPQEKMAQNQARMAARGRFAYVDRVPVGFCLVPRYFTPLFNMRYGDYFTDVETQFYWQLQFAKYRIERVPEDTCCCGTDAVRRTYFDNVIEAHAMGAEVVWPENETLQSMPTMHTVEEMERFEIPAPMAGLWGRMVTWWQRMQELAADTQLTFHGVEGHVEVGLLGISGMGPHMTAVDLVGTDFYWWMMRNTRRHATVSSAKITTAMLQADAFFRTINPRPRGGFGLAEDTVQIMSAESYRDMVLPYDVQLFEALGAGLPFGRGMHMCGDSTHLHQVLRDEVGITSFDIFGYLVPPQVAARNLGGRVALWGNINPMLHAERHESGGEGGSTGGDHGDGPMRGIPAGRRGECLPGHATGESGGTDRGRGRIWSAGGQHAYRRG